MCTPLINDDNNRHENTMDILCKPDKTTSYCKHCSSVQTKNKKGLLRELLM